MGSVADAVAKKMAACERELKSASKTSVGDASLIMKNSVLREGRRATGGDLKLSGIASSLNARYDVKQFDDRWTSYLKAVGAWQLVENDTDPHYIVAGLLGQRSTRSGRQDSARRAGAAAAFGGQAAGVFGGFTAKSYKTRKGQTRTRKGARAMKIGGNLRAYVAHPGTRGKHPWRKGIDASRDDALKLLGLSETKAVTRGFRS